MKIKQSLELLPWVHKSKVKANGKAPLYIRITILGNPSKEIPLGSVEPRNWDSSSKAVLKTEPGYRDINHSITEVSGELIRIYKKLCVQYAEEDVTPLMVKESYERTRNEIKSDGRQDFTSSFPVQMPLAQQPTIPIPTFDHPIASAINGFATLPYISGNAPSSRSSSPNAFSSVQEMQALFSTMQIQLHAVMQQMASFDLQPHPLMPQNPILELQQNYNNLLAQFNQLVVAGKQAEAPPTKAKLEKSNFSLMDGFSEFIDRFEKLVEKGLRSDGTLRQWKSTKRKVQKFLEDKYHTPDILYTDVTPDFGDILYDYFTLEVDRPLDEATAKKHIKKTKQILKIGVKKTCHQRKPHRRLCMWG